LSALLSSPWDFLRLYGSVHVAFPRRNCRKEPALLLPLPSAPGSTGDRQVPGGIDSGRSYVLYLFGLIFYPDVRTFRSARQGLCFRRRRPGPFMGLLVGDFACVPGLWRYFPRAQPGHQKPDHSRHRRSALGNLSCCAALVAAEVQRDVLPEAAV